MFVPFLFSIFHLQRNLTGLIAETFFQEFEKFGWSSKTKLNFIILNIQNIEYYNFSLLRCTPFPRRTEWNNSHRECILEWIKAKGLIENNFLYRYAFYQNAFNFNFKEKRKDTVVKEIPAWLNKITIAK